MVESFHDAGRDAVGGVLAQHFYFDGNKRVVRGGGGGRTKHRNGTCEPLNEVRFLLV